MPFHEFDVGALLVSLFWLWMLIDCLFNRGVRGGAKICWFLLILLTHIVGAVIYFFVACNQHNPIEAFQSYYRTLTGSQGQGQPPQSRSQPPPFSYTDYRQGYQERQPYQQEAAPITHVDDLPHDYEQPSASYPEMPQQQ